MARRGVVNDTIEVEKTVRPVRWRRYPYLFLIVCEDEKTEPYYFKTFVEKFPEETVYIRTIGTGRDSKGVVEQAIIEKANLCEESNKNIDEVWAVFDKDDADLRPGVLLRFNDAFKLAQEKDIKISYSNEVFELWLLLHFIEIEHNVALSRQSIYTKLEEQIRSIEKYSKFVYEHGKVTVIDVLRECGDQDRAIERAELLLSLHNQMGTLPINANPCTTVHILVKRLNELIEWYNEPI